MFGDFMGMMKTMKETKAKVEETKKRLDHVYLKETSGNGMITVSLNVNQHIESIAIDDAILQDKDELEQHSIRYARTNYASCCKACWGYPEIHTIGFT